MSVAAKKFDTAIERALDALAKSKDINEQSELASIVSKLSGSYSLLDSASVLARGR